MTQIPTKACKRLCAAARLLRRDETGASALEWAIIAAVMVVAATAVGFVITNLVRDRTADLDACVNAVATAECGDQGGTTP